MGKSLLFSRASHYLRVYSQQNTDTWLLPVSDLVETHGSTQNLWFNSSLNRAIVADFPEQLPTTTSMLLRVENERASPSIFLERYRSRGGTVLLIPNSHKLFFQMSLKHSSAFCISSDLIPSWMFLGGGLVG